MRLIRKLGWPTIVIAALLLVILSGLGIFHLRQASDESRLSDEVVLAKASLDASGQEQAVDREEMTSRLTEISVELEQAQALLSRTTESIEATETLFNIAAAQGVVIDKLVILPESTTVLAGLECSKLSVSLSVGGSADEMVNFITALNRDVVNGVVTSVSMDVPVEFFGLIATADIDLIIYFYRGIYFYLEEE